MKQAGVMLVIRDGLILGITRRNDKTKYGLPGGKFDPDRKPIPDKTTKDTAIAETEEETSVKVNDAVLIYHRVEPGDGPDGVDFHSYCYYAADWTGEPLDSEEGEVKWLTVEEITDTKAAFGEYNKKTLAIFRQMFPKVFLKGVR
jgi:ADP-ribose pyrophosphatase YjhB (NUDIX family)